MKLLVLIACSYIIQLVHSDVNDPLQNMDCYSSQPHCTESSYQYDSEIVHTNKVHVKGFTILDEVYEKSYDCAITSEDSTSYMKKHFVNTLEIIPTLNSTSSMWVSETPVEGNGVLSRITMNVEVGGWVHIHFLQPHGVCGSYFLFWDCSTNETDDFSSGTYAVFEELHNLLFDDPAETFMVMNSKNFELSAGTAIEIEPEILFLSGQFVSIDSENATLNCFQSSSSFTQSISNSSCEAPFSDINIEYKTHQTYILGITGSQMSVGASEDEVTLVESTNSFLDVDSGYFTLKRNLTGYFSSFNISFEIDSLKNLYENENGYQFSMLSFIDGVVLGLPSSSQMLYDLLDIGLGPLDIIGAPAVVTYPDKTYSVQLSREGDLQESFWPGVTSTSWALSMPPDDVSFASSNAIDTFVYSEFTIPAICELEVELTTNMGVTFKHSLLFEYKSTEFSKIECLENCDSEKTRPWAALRLRGGAALEATAAKYGIRVLQWRIIDIDADKDITSSVADWDNQHEVSVNTSRLTGIEHKAILTVYTEKPQLTLVSEYFFNMTQDLFSLSCTVSPTEGNPVEDKFDISCELSIRGEKCSLCSGGFDGMCTICQEPYWYHFRLCSDGSLCEIKTPLHLGYSALPTLAKTILSSVPPSDVAFLEVTMYDHLPEKLKILDTTCSAGPLQHSVSFKLADFLNSLDLSNVTDNPSILSTLQIINAALSSSQDIDEKLLQNLVDFLKSLPDDNDDISMASFLLTVPLSDRCQGNEWMTEELTAIADADFKGISDTGVSSHHEDGAGATLAVVKNLADCNINLSGADESWLPDLNFALATQSPDKKYYDRWVGFDPFLEGSIQDTVDRSGILCSTIQHLQDYVIAALGSTLNLGTSAELEIDKVQFQLGFLTLDMIKTGVQLVGERYTSLSVPYLSDSSVSDLIISFLIMDTNPCILTHNSNRVKSAVVGVYLTDLDGKKLEIVNLTRPAEVLLPFQSEFNLREMIYNPKLGLHYTEIRVSARYNSALILQMQCNRSLSIFVAVDRLPRVDSYDYLLDGPSFAYFQKKNEILDELRFSPLGATNRFNVRVPLPTNGTYYIGVKVHTKVPRMYHILPYLTACLQWDGTGWEVSADNVGDLSNITATHCKFDRFSLYAADLALPPFGVYSVLVERSVLPEVMRFVLILLPILVCVGYFFSTFKLLCAYDERDIVSSGTIHILSPNKTKYPYKIAIKTGLRFRGGTSSKIKLELHGTLHGKTIDISQKLTSLFAANQTTHFLYYSDVALGKVNKITVSVDYTGDNPDWFLDSICITADVGGRVFWFKHNSWIGYQIDRCACIIPRYYPEYATLPKRMFISFCSTLMERHSFLAPFTKSYRPYPPRSFLQTLVLARWLTTLALITINIGEKGLRGFSFEIFYNSLGIMLVTMSTCHLYERTIEWLLRNQIHNFLERRKLTRSTSQKSVITFSSESYFWVSTERPIKYNLSEDSFAETSDDEIIHTIDTPFGEHNVRVQDYFTMLRGDEKSVSSGGSTLFEWEAEKQTEVVPRISLRFTSRFLEKVLRRTPYVLAIAAAAAYLVYAIANRKQVDIVTAQLASLMVAGVIVFVEQPIVCLLTSLLPSFKIWFVKAKPDTFCNYDYIADEKVEVVRAADAAVAGNSGEDSFDPAGWIGRMEIRNSLNTVAVRLVSYLCFIMLVLYIGSHDRQKNCFYLNTSVRELFANKAFQSIQTQENFWDWIKTDYASLLSSTDFYKDTRVKAPKEVYLKDSSSLIISISRMRQIRVKPVNSSLSNVVAKNWNPSLSEAAPDEVSYNPGWTPLTPVESEEPFATFRYKSYWQHQEDEDRWSVRGRIHSYPQGGYMVPIANSPASAAWQMEKLQKDRWVDHLTRAVFIELSVYNPPTGFLCALKLIVEFLPTGNAVSFSTVHSINFQRYSNPISPDSILPEMAYTCALIVLSVNFVVNYARNWHTKHDVWRGFWTLLDATTLLIGWTSSTVYILRSRNLQAAILLFMETPYYYVDFHYAAALDIYFGYCLGVLVFIVTLKIIDLILVHRKVKIMTIIIHNSVVELVSFALPFFIYVAMFAQVFFLLYGSFLEEFLTLPSSAGQTLSIIVGDLDWGKMMAVRPIITPIFVLGLGILSIAYLANVFAVIVCYNMAYRNPGQIGNAIQHLNIFGYLKKWILDTIFVFVPILETVYMKLVAAELKNVPENNYVVCADVAEKVGEKERPNAPKVDMKGLIIKLERRKQHNVRDLKLKLEKQEEMLAKLEHLLNTLVIRLEKFIKLRNITF